jgi:site-specific recombinase XerD
MESLKNPLYVRQLAGFTEWLRIMNFEPTSRRDMPGMLENFLLFLEARGCAGPGEIREELIQTYLDELALRPCKTHAGAWALNYVRKYLQVIRKFARYLSGSGQESFSETIELKGDTVEREILTPAEVSQLYAAAGDDLLGLRDKAMLALYYGCGLRKEEGIALNISDILLEKDLVLVRKGKGYKARFVPLTGANKETIETYLNYARPYLLNGSRETAFLVGILSKRFKNPQGRLETLRQRTGIKEPFGPHTLRHSIATHLIESGMPLEQVKDFLGHASLESTQIYTHVSAA